MRRSDVRFQDDSVFGPRNVPANVSDTARFMTCGHYRAFFLRQPASESEPCTTGLMPTLPQVIDLKHRKAAMVIELEGKRRGH